jgi:hypothetical protein
VTLSEASIGSTIVDSSKHAVRVFFKPLVSLLRKLRLRFAPWQHSTDPSLELYMRMLRADERSSLFPTSCERLLESGPLEALRKGDSLVRAGQLDLAEQYFSDVIHRNVSGRHFSAVVVHFAAGTRLADIHLAREDALSAVADLNRLIELHGKTQSECRVEPLTIMDPLVRMDLQSVCVRITCRLIKSGDVISAMDVLEKARELAPEFASPRISLRRLTPH